MTGPLRLERAGIAWEVYLSDGEVLAVRVGLRIRETLEASEAGLFVVLWDLISGRLSRSESSPRDGSQDAGRAPDRRWTKDKVRVELARTLRGNILRISWDETPTHARWEAVLFDDPQSTRALLKKELGSRFVPRETAGFALLAKRAPWALGWFGHPDS